MFGTVQSYVDQKGYGFILIEGKNRGFFHIKNFFGEVIPYPGMQVEFDLAPALNPKYEDQAVHIIPTGVKS